MNIKNITGENKTASIGISFDIPNEKEIIAIGSPDRLKAYFTLGIENSEIEVRTRKLGSLVDEMNELAQSDADDKMQILAECSNGLCGIISDGQGNKSADEYINALAKLYDSSGNGNMLLPFRNLPTVPESDVRYWNIPEQINASPTGSYGTYLLHAP